MRFSDFECAGKRKQTRRERFLTEMEQVVPWSGLVELIEPHYPKAGGGRKPYPLDTMLRIHLLQNWFSLSDSAMDAALYEITSMREFARLTLSAPILEDTTIMSPSTCWRSTNWLRGFWKPSTITCETRVYRCARVPLSTSPSSTFPVLPGTRKPNAIPRCIRRRKAINISLA